MRASFYPKGNEQEQLMDLVCMEQMQRWGTYDNYNTQEEAYRQAIIDGAMRTDNYFKK